jgi:hypothetical protein
MGIGATPRGDPFTVVQRPCVAPLRGGVMRIAQPLPPLQRPWCQPRGGEHLGGLTGHSALRGPGEPDAADGDGQRQLPAVPPAVIPGLAPRGCGVHGGMGDCPSQPMVLVPHTAVGTQGRTVARRRVALGGPRPPPPDQMAPQTPKQCGPPRRQFRKAPFPRAPRGTTPLCRQQGPHLLHHWVRLVQQAEQGLGRRESSNDHDDQRFDKELVGIDLLPPTRAWDRWRGRGHLLDEPE